VRGWKEERKGKKGPTWAGSRVKGEKGHPTPRDDARAGLACCIWARALAPGNFDMRGRGKGRLSNQLPFWSPKNELPGVVRKCPEAEDGAESDAEGGG